MPKTYSVLLLHEMKRYLAKYSDGICPWTWNQNSHSSTESANNYPYSHTGMYWHESTHTSLFLMQFPDYSSCGYKKIHAHILYSTFEVWATKRFLHVNVWVHFLRVERYVRRIWFHSQICSNHPRDNLRGSFTASCSEFTKNSGSKPEPSPDAAIGNFPRLYIWILLLPNAPSACKVINSTSWRTRSKRTQQGKRAPTASNQHEG